MKLVYRAFDDTEFATEEECLAYENEQNNRWDIVVYSLDCEEHKIDFTGKNLTYCEQCEAVEELINQSAAVKFGNEESYRRVRYDVGLCIEDRSRRIEDVTEGIFVWNEERERYEFNDKNYIKAEIGDLREKLKFWRYLKASV
jgi:hypothetical protein